MLARFSLSLSVAAVLVLVLVVPIVRMRLRHGITGVAVHRDVTPFQRTMGVALGLMFGALAVVSVAHGALSPEALGVWSAPHPVGVAGWCVLAFGVAVISIAQAQMGASWRIGIDSAKTSLVDVGLFRLVRNPIYSGMGLALAGALLIAPCGFTVMLTLQGCVLLALQARLEEEHLLREHGASYEAYAARVGRFVPFVGRRPARDPGSPIVSS
jgi:protein-S-isoprenylcysteine O-methyltransferase Ste14